MFVEDSNKESETVKPRTSQEASAPATVAVPSPVVTSVPTPTIMASGDVDTKLVELLERKINEANLPGPDYLELLQSAEQMKQYIPDETTRLKAAFGSIQGMDPRMTKDVVLASIDTYLGVNEEKQSFAWKSSVRRLSRTRQRSWKQRIFVSSSFVRNWKLSRTSRLISTQRSRRIQLKPLLSKLERMQPSTRLRIAWVRTRSDWHKFCKYDAAWRFKSL